MNKKGVFSVFKKDSTRQPSLYCRWTEQEDQLLSNAIQLYGPHAWTLIARHIPGRTPVQCSARWLGALNPQIHKGKWSKQEDDALTAAIASFKGKAIAWSQVAASIPNRTGIQCQARWTEALDPNVRKGRWRKEEDEMLQLRVETYGCCWIRVAESIPGRTQRQCRTRYHQIQYKRQPRKRKKKKEQERASPIQLVVRDQIPSFLFSRTTASNTDDEEDNVWFLLDMLLK
ncbi:Homeodomain-like protein [Gilbertella persicaria]|uniref:Homeodomain-like protein n=1 Tax=Gilbertella persicaria TaxID=101096 RepID=UPI00222009B3|nr:Homeodomain-like protein [Gilbertella persicaria]KAI8085838.1 Homeodomain-like protein [Gilbertella persicaria]